MTVGAPRRGGLALLAALFVASLALRPQLVGVGPILPDIEADLGVSHAVAGLLGTLAAFSVVTVGLVGLLGLAALPEAAFAWSTLTGAAIGAVFPLSLTLCLDVAADPADAGAVAALVLLGGYLLSSLSPVGLGALRDATGSFSPVLWTMFGAAVLLLACCLPLTAERLRPA
jgi:MFS transporter, CP family, cyanate transporter